MQAHPELAGLLLAAGESSRLGEPKQLVTWHGKPLILSALEHALAVCGAGVTIVTGAYADQVEAAVAGKPVSLLKNSEWQRGIGSSVRCGITSIADTGARATLMLLSDQPLVSTDDLAALVRLWTKDADQPVATCFADGNGVPAIFPERLFPALMGLPDHEGARGLLGDLPEDRLLRIPGADLDIDTPDDLQQLLQNTSD